MSIASEITSIGENLKKDYQSIANLGADLTNVDKNIENIAELLDGVYDNLPKTEYQEGTEINLGKTIKGKLDYENGAVGIGQTEQDSTQGYNLINASLLPVSSNGFTITRDNNGNIIINGTPNYSSGYKNIVLGTATTLQAGTYTASVQNKIDGIGLDVGGFGGSLNLVMSGTTSSKTSSSSQAEECILSINVRSDVGTLTNFVLNPMVVSGATVKDYEKYTGGQASPNPSYPQQIKSVTGNQDVVVSGINVANENEIQIGKSWNNQVNTSRATILFIPIEKGVTYSFASAYTNSHITNIRAVLNYGVEADNRNLVVNATTFNTDTYTHVSLEILADTTFTQAMLEGTKIFLCKGEGTISDYEPYITPTSYQLSLGDRKVYEGDYLWIDKTTGKKYHHHNTSFKTLNTSNVTIFAYSDTGSYVNITKTSLNIPRDASTGTTLCSAFKEATNDTNFVVGTYRNNANVDNLRVKMPSSVTDLDEAKAYLNSINSDFVGVIRTETDEEITGTLAEQLEAWYNAQSIKGTTIITSNGDLPIVIKCRGLKGE